MTCVKIRYRDEATAVACAQLDARAASTLRGVARTPLTAYRCPRCRGWHLTSQTKRPAA